MVAAPVMRGLVCFDVDGTLVPGTSSCAWVAAALGHEAELVAAEAAYVAGRMTNQEASVIDARGWAGHTEAEISARLETLPLVDGIAETVAWCHDHGLRPILTTLAWTPVGRMLAGRFGFAAYCGPVPEAEDGRYTGRVAEHLDEYGKRDFALSQGFAPQRCAAVGDSRSDLPLFAAVGTSIGFNAAPAARAVATHVVDGPDLRAIIPVLAAQFSSV
ncbi:HAD-IB family phosphatase [Amycolatopsis sp. DG1A-15b]|uniref:HAD family hydrolase n=1 Tax=Amycolatopsis sp. DG1A-15b TaxID=3052846 RepID=UPI00255B95AC|nr:HAD-IB family phosphatase [Amycolatopsis sp. DG1A-15b]WIX92904.1 HAD-IB family phosphatase [Amycolatopsis sp. DG1A-15b]